MNPPLIRHAISVGRATPVFAIAGWCGIAEPGLLNPWHRSSGYIDINLWFLVLPPLVCSSSIIVIGTMDFRSALKSASKPP